MARGTLHRPCASSAEAASERRHRAFGGGGSLNRQSLNPWEVNTTKQRPMWKHCWMSGSHCYCLRIIAAAVLVRSATRAVTPISREAALTTWDRHGSRSGIKQVRYVPTRTTVGTPATNVQRHRTEHPARRLLHTGAGKRGSRFQGTVTGFDNQRDGTKPSCRREFLRGAESLRARSLEAR